MIVTSFALALGVGVWGALPHGPLVITPPPIDGEPGRWVHLEGAANTRDLGGYETRDGRIVRPHRLYRSGALSHLSSHGVENFRKLGIRTVIDLRNRISPMPLFNGDSFGVYVSASVHGCPMAFRKQVQPNDFYTRGVESNRQSFREAFELLSHEANYPVLFHCAAGTDRTGVTSALLLSLLGVDRETIVADFRLSEKVNAPGHLEALNALLDRVEADGGIAAYLSGIGVSPEAQERIRAALLESNDE